MTGPELDRALFHWPAVIRSQAKGSWEHGFALSVQKNARNPRWRPTERQAQVIRNMVATMFQPAGQDMPLIETEAASR